ncbi:hypothetical protein DENSPDRAFT_857644 [Dentipellis sp. KUC8613]|nr:hypothetical protein DENSPDRAFT_857644 [Dentipellis sp. KUC8613]
MSALAAATRARASVHLLNVSRNAGPSLSNAGQVRGLMKMPQGARRNAGKGKDKKKGGEVAVPQKREKRAGAFRPLPAGQLTHNIFQNDRVTELHLPVFVPEQLTQANASKAMALPMPENDAARIFGIPKNLIVDFRVLSKPATVIRDVTLKVVDRLQAASQQSSANNRVVLAGASGSGKSYLLLQAVEYAAASKWIVMYIPRAINLVNSTTPYVYDLRTQTYLQPAFAFQTLQRFLKVNEAALRSLKTTTDVEVERRAPVPAGTSLADLVQIGVKDQTVAPTVLSAVLEQLGKQTDYPVLLAVDDFQALFCKSSYRAPSFSSIKAWHLSMPRTILDYASGQKTFARGAVLGAISSTNTTFRLSPELRHALGIQSWLRPSPYQKIAPEIVEFTKGIETLRVPDQLSVNEAASLFEVWMKDKALHTTGHDDELFMSKYTESAGNARDFVWKGLLSTLES